MWEFDGRVKEIEGGEVHGVTNKKTGKVGGFIGGLVILSEDSVIDEGSYIINFSNYFPLYLHNSFIMGTSEIKVGRGGTLRDCFFRDSSIFDEVIGTTTTKYLALRNVNMRSDSNLILRWDNVQNTHNAHLNLSHILVSENAKFSVGQGNYKDIIIGENSKFIVRPGFYRNIVSEVKLGNGSMFCKEANNPLVMSKVFVDSGFDFKLASNLTQFFTTSNNAAGGEVVIDNVWVHDDLSLKDMKIEGFIIKDLTVERGKPINNTIPHYAKQNIIRNDTKH